jgi:hypothetical protein
MDFANAFPWKSEMIFNFCKWISKILEMHFQDFGNGFSIFENGLLIFGN